MPSEAGWLWFWRLRPGMSVDPENLCERLEDDEEPPELVDLPVEEILAALSAQYPSLDLDRERGFGEVKLPEEDTTIEPRWGKSHFCFAFYGDAWQQMDRVVELMTRFGLPCYEAYHEQKMYTVEDPPRFAGTPEEEALERDVDEILKEEASKLDPKDPNWLKSLGNMFESGAVERAQDEATQRAKAKKKPGK